MMTPKMREAAGARLHSACRQLFLSARIADRCTQEATQKQMDFVTELLEDELALREENRKSRLFKRAGFPSYKVLLPTLFDRYVLNLSARKS